MATCRHPNCLIVATLAVTVEISEEIALKNVGNLSELLSAGEVAVKDTWKGINRLTRSLVRTQTP